MESKRSSGTAATKIKGCLESNYADTLALTDYVLTLMSITHTMRLLATLAP